MASYTKEEQESGVTFNAAGELDYQPDMLGNTDSVGSRTPYPSAAATHKYETNAGYNLAETTHTTYAQPVANDDSTSGGQDGTPIQGQIREEPPWRKNWRHGYRGPLQTGHNGTSIAQDTSPTAISSDRMAGAFKTQQTQDYNKPMPIPNSSLYSLVENPIQSATPTNSTRGTMPKNFKQPLTCFYWFTYGECSKADDLCLYAHYPTGVVASGPVTVGGSKGPVAGRNAVNHINKHVVREKELKDWHAMLAAKEMELNGRATSGRADYKAEASIRAIHKTIAAAKETASNTCGLLKQRRKGIADADSSFDTVGSESIALNAIEAAIEAVTSMLQDFLYLDNDLEAKLGKRETVPETVDIYLDATE